MSRFLKNSGWNLAGLAIPTVMGFISIPLLIAGIGDSRFGFLSIAWMLVGYFGVLDLGIGRALTHGVSKRLADDADRHHAELEWTGLSMLGALGIVTALALVVAAGWLVGSFINIPEALEPEALGAMLILTIAVPFVLLSAGLTGILQARQEFRVINLIQIPLGVLLYGGPLIAIQYSVALPYVILPLVLVRVANCLVLFAVCARTVPGFLHPAFSRATARELLGFGGWMTVTNVVSPIMVNMDRLFIGSRLDVAQVTYYATPFDVVSKMLMVPSAIAGVSFPEFSRMARRGERDAARVHFRKSLGIVLACLIPPAIFLAVFAHAILTWWISPELADRSATVMRVLLLGVVINGAAYIPFAYVQGTGRSDVTAQFHLMEFALYVPLLLFMISWLGLVGVAVAWVIRVALDAALLFGYSWKHLGRPT